MACVLDATVGGVAANSYATIVQADTYFQARLHATEWPLLTPDDKCRALAWATRLLEAWVEWRGSAATYTQRLAWPRWGLLKVTGDVIPATELPHELVEATCELAAGLRPEDVTLLPAQASAGLSGLTAGPVRLDFFGPGTGSLPAADRILPPAVWGLIQQWATTKRGASGTIPLVRA